MSVTKKKREKPCKPRGVDSKGEHGAKRHPLTHLQKVLMGKGAFQSFRPIGTPEPKTTSNEENN